MSNTDEKHVEARIKDIFEIASRRGEKKASNFLDPQEQEIAKKVARSYPEVNFYFDGGYDEAERKIVVVCPEEWGDEPYNNPIGALRITPNDTGVYPGHRDYLGAILNLGINREKLGDILVYKNGADVIVRREVVEYIGINLFKVKSTSVTVQEISLKELLKPERMYKEIAGTVASLRLDAVAGMAFGLSRSKMVPFIKGENIRVNFKVVKDPSASVKEGDIISATRLGRAKIFQVGGKSKKGRTYVKIHRYISR